MTEADIGMTEHRSKNTLGRSVPDKTMTDVEDGGTSEDRSPRPVCNMHHMNICTWQFVVLCYFGGCRIRVYVCEHPHQNNIRGSFAQTPICV